MKVLVVGGSGFVGTPLIEALRARGDDIVVTGRSEARLRKKFPGATCVEWDPNTGPLPPEALEGVDGVINLAGEPVAKGRWTKGKKERIRDSRVIGTRNLIATIADAAHKPKVLVNASAVGWYGSQKQNWLHEGSPSANDFLGEVCQAWEAEARKARDAGVRTAIVRVGVVLGKGGGAYPEMSLPFRLFAGGTIGLGRMWLSWIHLDDIVGVLLHCLDDARADAVYNGTAPNPVSNREFTATLAAVLHRPALMIVPPIMLRLMKGEFATIITSSQRVRPLRTLGLGYEYRFPKLEPALRDLEG